MLKKETQICRKCGGNSGPSKAIINIHHIDKSFNRGEVEFETKLINCTKCLSCGHSWIDDNNDYPTQEKTQLDTKWEDNNKYSEAIEFGKWLDENTQQREYYSMSAMTMEELFEQFKKK